MDQHAQESNRVGDCGPGLNTATTTTTTVYLRVVDDVVNAVIEAEHLRVLEAHRVEHAEERHGRVQVERLLGHPRVVGLEVTASGVIGNKQRRKTTSKLMASVQGATAASLV